MVAADMVVAGAAAWQRTVGSASPVEGCVVAALLIDYARVSTEEQDLTAQRIALIELGIARAWIYVDHGLTGTNRDRPGHARRSRPAGPVTR